MAEKKDVTINKDVQVVEESANDAMAPTASSELDQLRNIVFGSAKADLESNLAQLQHEMREGFAEAAKNLQQQVTNMQSALQDSVHSLEDRIAWVDNQHDEKSAELNAYADKLAAELEMNDTNSKQQDDELHKRLDNEIDQLTNKFTQQHDQTIELLNQVKKELNSSKTDRKTLARLLATVADNLDTDEEL